MSEPARAPFVQLVAQRNEYGADELICLDADGNVWRLEGGYWQRLTDERRP